MTTEFFKLENITPLQDLPPGARIHVIGVCGVAMAQMAVALAEKGYQVSGSDKEFYEPMGSLLERANLELFRGYAESNIRDSYDLVVIGNAVSRTHVEVMETERRKLRYSIFPAILRDLCIEGRHSIVVTGTHGKTTTTAMGAFVLAESGRNPSFFVGGVAHGLPSGLQANSGNESIVEGDEYDSAFFAKLPKFSFYQPRTLIITSIEYDHADIYPSLESILVQFEGLIKTVPKNGHIVWCADDRNVRALITRLQKSGQIQATCSSYGQSEDAMLQVESVASAPGLQQVEFREGSKKTSLDLKIPGVFNASNAAAIFLALAPLGLSSSALAKGISAFQGVKRRQEIRFDGAVTLIEDFAHHPSAVRETLKGLKSAYGARRLWAIFEPRSNTSRKKVFESEYAAAFGPADQVILSRVSARSNDRADDMLDVETLAETIAKTGTRARAIAGVEEIARTVLNEAASQDVIVVMSNGGFGGLIDKLESGLRARWGGRAHP